MGIHYDYKSTKSAKLMEKQAKREKKLAEKKAKRLAKDGPKKQIQIYASVVKWYNKSLVRTNSLVSTGWEHHFYFL